MSSITKFQDLNVNDISFSKPKINSRGGQTIYLAYHGSPIMMQIPKTKCPFGLNQTNYDDSVKFDISLSLGGSDAMDLFNKWVFELDQYICKIATENSEEWFGKKKSEAVVEELYKSVMMNSKNGEYKPTMKFKMPYYDGKHSASIFDSNKNEQPPSIITKGSDVTVIAKISSMWFVGKQFGITWQLMQARVSPKQGLNEYAFVDEDDQ